MVPALIAEILDRIKNEEDPDTLNKYRALVRKNVPFFMRSYFAAYLYMQIDRAVPARGSSQKGQGKKNDRRDAQNGRRDEKPGKTREAQPERAPRESRVRDENREPRESRHSIPEAEAASVFVSAGRNRRAYGRDLLGLILNTTAIAKEDVGEIRVLDNFSFVQVRKTVADELIAALDGKEFRGRALSVSYAKPRKENGPRDEAELGEESLASDDDDRFVDDVAVAGSDGLDSIDSEYDSTDTIDSESTGTPVGDDEEEDRKDSID